MIAHLTGSIAKFRSNSKRAILHQSEQVSLSVKDLPESTVKKKMKKALLFKTRVENILNIPSEILPKSSSSSSLMNLSKDTQMKASKKGRRN